MNNLWAPWRMQFIEDLRDTARGCVFCELCAAGEDRARLVLARHPHAYIVMNRYPYNSGHLLIVPHRHVSALTALGSEEHGELMKLTGHSVDILMRVLNAEGANCGINMGKAGGAGIVDHVHIHVVPRWCGDTNFMPIISDTRSMPEYLENTYDRLVGEFKKLSDIQ